MADDLDDKLTRWAAWRHRPNGYGRSVIERMLSGMPSRTCRTCGGRKTVLGRACLSCGGRGRLHRDVHGKVNPALIPVTAPPSPGDEIERIEVIFSQHLTARQREVLVERYWGLGRNQDKAARLRMSLRTYERQLRTARVIVECHLNGRAPQVA